MIDLHAHILPGCDDGARGLTESLSMARMAVADGIRVMACTPHIVPGLYDNTAAGIGEHVKTLREALQDADVHLQLVVGADVHVAPDLPQGLSARKVPTLNGSRYFLLEPPHHVLPPKLEELVERLVVAGFVPILTHPERLSWIRSHYEVIQRISALGCLMQVTAASLSGGFGKTAAYYSERMLDEGRVDVIATDAHNTTSRPPIMSRARDLIEARLGKQQADDMVLHRPAKILKNEDVTALGKAPGLLLAKTPPSARSANLRRWFSRGKP